MHQFLRGVLALGLTLFFSTLHAQDFREGYIVSLAGDTTYGFTAIRNESVDFKPSAKADTKSFAATDLKGFGRTNKQYEAKPLPLAGAQRTPVFAESIVRGAMNLYLHNDIFYVLKDTSAYYLEPGRRIVNGAPVRSTKFVGVLNALMADCYQGLTNLSYEESDLAKVVSKYNQCRGGGNELVKDKVASSHVDFLLFAGIDRGQASLHQLQKFSYVASISIPVGVGLRLSLPRQTDKVSALLEVQYDKKHFQVYDETMKDGELTRADFIARYTYVKVPVGIQYNFRRPAATPYIKGGVVRHFALKVSGLVKSETEKNGIVTKDFEEYDFTKKSGYGFWTAAGYQKQLGKTTAGFAELRFERSTVFTYDTPGSSSRLNLLTLYVGIIL